MLRLLLEVLATEHAGKQIAGPPLLPDAELQADTAISRGCPSFERLQHHPPSFTTSKEASEWSSTCRSFRAIVEQCEWCPWSIGRECGSGGGGSGGGGSGGGGSGGSCGGAGIGTSPPPPTSPPTDTELHALVSRIDSNCFGVFRMGHGEAASKTRTNAAGRNVDLLGRGVYLDACLFNHSCAPNCSVSTGVHSLHVTVDEAVEAGDELTISYCDLLQPYAARQRYLRKAYHFDCACERCTAEAAGDREAAAAVKLSYSSGGGTKQPARSKKERRERREERKPSASIGSTLTAAAATSVHVHVDLRVLLKLVKAATPTAEAQDAEDVGASSTTPRRSKGGGNRSRRIQQLQPQRKEPVCCVFLKCKAARPNPAVIER